MRLQFHHRRRPVGPRSRFVRVTSAHTQKPRSLPQRLLPCLATVAVVVLLILIPPVHLHAQPAAPNRVLELDGNGSYVELPPNIFKDLEERLSCAGSTGMVPDLTATLVTDNETGMGEIVVNVELENFVDRALQKRTRSETNHVRRHVMKAVADTGAVMLALPQDVVEKLGLEIQRTVVVSYADERKEERPVAGAVTIKIGDRAMTTECIVGPPTSEALIGQVVMEELDLIADPQKRTLTPRPESPIYPSLKLKRLAQQAENRIG